MAGSKQEYEYVIGKRSITSGKKVHTTGKVVTPEIMRLTEEQFKDLVKKGEKGGVIKRKIVEPAHAAPPVSPAAPAVVLSQNERYEAIAVVIKGMYDKEGKPLNKDNFTGQDMPRVEFVTAQLKATAGFEDGITGPEIGGGYKLYKESLKK